MNRSLSLGSFFLSVILFSLLAGLLVVEASSEPSFPFSNGILISSPSNRTYTSRVLILNVSFGGLVGATINHSLTYSLDGIYSGPIPLTPHYPEKLSFQGSFTGTLILPELPKGSHSITIFAEHNIYNFTENGIYYDKITQLENNTVYFTISDIIPVNEIMPPVISDLSVANGTYNLAEFPLNFKVDKSVTWVGYCLDRKETVTIASWYNIDASERRFNTILKGLSDGSHNITVYATDAFGNTGVSDTVSFAIDTVPPTMSNLTIQNETYTSNELELNFSVNEAASWMAYSLDNQANVTILGNTTITGLLNGQHNITVYANDTAGNFGASETAYFSVEVPEPFPKMLIVASSVSVATASLGLLFYFKRPRRISLH